MSTNSSLVTCCINSISSQAGLQNSSLGPTCTTTLPCGSGAATDHGDMTSRTYNQWTGAARCRDCSRRLPRSFGQCLAWR
eukprot:3932262-Amphidinium_carterae.1